MDDKLTDFDACFETANEISKSKNIELLIKVIERWDIVHPSIKPIFSSLIESLGLYPYLNKSEDLDLAASIRAEYHKSEYVTRNGNKISFHLEQKILEEKITQRKNLLVSAPTSFGKSLLIEEFVARRKFNNILVIQPTLALIDETRRKFQEYDDYYNIVVNTRQEIRDRNLFILTSERALEILPHIDNIDLFVVDEFYKITSAKKDERVAHLNIAFYKVMKFFPQLLLLTPSIDSVSGRFIEKYELEFFKTDYSLVNQNLYKVDFIDTTDKDIQLINLLESLIGSTIVYVKSPKEAERLASLIIDKINKSQKNDFPIFEWIDENVSSEWKLKEYLKNGVGIHNGQYPRHIVNSQLEYFNSGSLEVIFATTSLIEGVNSVAKNVVIYDMLKGSKKLTYFDFNNIKGRAGRMMKYYTGDIYFFGTPPKQVEENLDIPVVDQNEDIQSEILINIDENDVKEDRKKDYECLISQIPVGLREIAKNNYYDISSQTRLYRYLFETPDILKRLVWSTPTPTYEQLRLTFEVIYTQMLARDGERTSRYFAAKCLQIANNNLKQAIKEETQYLLTTRPRISRADNSNQAISNIFKFVKNQAKYEVPRLLSILQSIVNYILEHKQLEVRADYSLFISKLEHEGVDERLNVLLDFGVPSSALKKISIPNEVDALTYIKENLGVLTSDLSKYELMILSKI